MPKKVKAARSSDPDSEANSEKVKSHSKKAGKGKKAKGKKGKNAGSATGTAQILSSEVVFEGRLFRVVRDRLIEPGGKEGVRDVVRHNGSAVILAIDNSKSRKDPWIVMERQYRHAANRFLWEVPAGKLDAGEDALAGAKRELEEETGYRAKKWTELVEYYASPGFLGESMKVFVAEGLVAGDARPEEDELIELRLVKLSELLITIEKGGIMDGKTLASVLLYARLLEKRRRK
jgi:ADP-ribose pyrophosphatase